MTFLLQDTALVAAGAALLDQEFEGWETQIDLDLLDLANGDNCILAQLYGDYEGGLSDLGVDGTDHGFYLAGTLTWRSEAEDARWATLTELWIIEIQNRTGE